MINRRLAGQALGITPIEIQGGSIYQDLDGTYVLGKANNVGEIEDLYNVELGPDPLRSQYRPIDAVGRGGVYAPPGFAIVNGKPMNLHQRHWDGGRRTHLGPLESAARDERNIEIDRQFGFAPGSNKFDPKIRNQWRAEHGMPPANGVEDFLARIFG